MIRCCTKRYIYSVNHLPLIPYKLLLNAVFFLEIDFHMNIKNMDNCVKMRNKRFLLSLTKKLLFENVSVKIL